MVSKRMSALSAGPHDWERSEGEGGSRSESGRVFAAGVMPSIHGRKTEAASLLWKSQPE